MALAELINLETYPIHRPGTVLDREIEAVRRDLARDGCAVLRGFLTAMGVHALVDEADSVAGNAHRSFNRTNPYFTQDM